MEVNCPLYFGDGDSTTSGTNDTAAPSIAGTLPAPMPITLTQVRLATGETTVVTGPNGVGKSALLGEIASGLRATSDVETFFGSRQIQFQSEEIDQLGQTLKTLQEQFRDHVTRFRHPWGEQHLKSVVRRIVNQQSQSTGNIVRAQDSGSSFDDAKRHHPLILATLNSIFTTAHLPIRIVLQDGTLRAQRGALEYGIDRLSDGERAALLVVGAVLIRPPNSFIIIDEPEKHLNPAISGTLLSTLVRTRSDIGFVFSTHDLTLIEWLRPDQIIHVRDSQVIIHEPREQRRFDAAILTSDEELPEDLRYAILGSRRRLLLVEGTATSEDQALYGHIYVEWNVVPRGGYETVAAGVRALSTNDHYHWLKVAGLIDADGRDENERSSLATENIYSLPVPTIENLFLNGVILGRMAAAAHDLHGGATGPERIAAMDVAVRAALAGSRDDIVARQMVWQANRLLSEKKPSVRSIRAGQTSIEALDLTSLKVRLGNEFDAALQSSNIDQILASIPVKNSAVPAAVADALGFPNFKSYQRAVLKQIESASDAGVAILDSLRQTMPDLPGD